MRVPVEPLEREAFRPFGRVIEAGAGEVLVINEGTCERHHALAPIDCADGRRPVLSIFRAKPRVLPMPLAMMERHPLGSQAFVPMPLGPGAEGRGEWLIVVAPDEGGRPGPPRAFLARGDQGVSYDAGAWHHPLIALGGERLFLVADAVGPEPNLEERRYPAPHTLEAPWPAS